MTTIQHSVVIRASPEAVFDLISQVEDFTRYTPVIRSIRAVGPGLYRWVVSAAGLELRWDAAVTVHERPRRFAWQSVRGIENGGAFELKPAAGGTEVCFAMHYRLPSALLERVVEIAAAPLMRRVAAGILEQVRERLEDPAAAAAR